MPLPDQTKIEHHLERIFPEKVANMQEILDLHIVQMKKRGDLQEVIDLVTLEAYGGGCPKCDKPWKSIHVENHYADFTYFDPVCKCYPRCGRCGSSLHREWASGDKMPCTCQKTPGAL